MASLYPVKGGYKICYTINGRRRYTPTIRSLKVAQQKLAQLEQLTEQAKLGLIDPRLDDFARAQAIDLTVHAKAFAKTMLDRGCSPRHASQTHRLVLDILEVGRFRLMSDLRPDDVQAAIEQYGQGGNRVENRSARTKNAAVTAMKAFAKWLRKSGKAPVHVLEDLESYNAAADPKHPRRSLSVEEVTNLLGAAAAGGKRGGVSGPDRAMLYRLMLGTGLRLSEALSLIPQSMHLSSTHPYVELAAKDEKNRKGVKQPIAQDLAAMLRSWIKGRPAEVKLWKWMPQAKPNLALQHDLGKAGVAYKDADGRFADFHALRHTYISWGLNSGVSLRTMQDLARHSTPMLTSHYGHVGVVDVQAALGKLPGAEVVKAKQKKDGAG